MNNYTKGPWVQSLIAEEGHDLKGRRYFSGRLWSEERDDYGRRKPVIVGSAVIEDWHVMGAAPELFEQLKAAVKFFEDNGGSKNFTFLRDMKAAIKKAEGGK